MMEMTRRKLVTTLITAPAIVPFTNLMKIVPISNKYLLHVTFRCKVANGRGAYYKEIATYYKEIESRRPVPNQYDPFRDILMQKALDLLPCSGDEVTITSHGWQLIEPTRDAFSYLTQIGYKGFSIKRDTFT